MSFDEILDYVEKMNKDEQDLLIEIIQKRRIENRREEILKNAKSTFEAIENGSAKKGTLEDILNDLEG